MNTIKRKKKKKPKKITHILVTGIPGAGKTTYAKKKAKELGIPHIELDKQGSTPAEEIIKETKKPSVIEGVQISDIDPSRLQGHKIKIIDAPDEIITKRWMDNNDYSGKRLVSVSGVKKRWGTLSKRKKKERIKKDIAKKRKHLNRFKRKMKK